MADINREKLIHGGDIYSARQKFAAMGKTPEVLDFSANINPLGIPEGVKKAIVDSMESYDAYPDPLCRALTAELAGCEEVPQDWIFCGNGAADIIYRTVQAVKPKKAMVLAPTFAEYEEALYTVNCEVVRYRLYEQNLYQTGEELLDTLSEDLDMLFLCNPNNPTGQLMEKDFLLRVLERCRDLGILLFLDECFNDFLEEPAAYSLKEYLGDFKNLLILKAFTKIYALAGLRLGHCLTCNQDLMKRIRRAGQPWSVSIPAQTAGIQAIREQDYLHQSRTLIREERLYLAEKLKKFGFTVFPSNANYLFIKDSRTKKRPLHEQLFEQGILIRNCDNYHGLGPGYYRICVKKREENIKLIDALESIKE